MTEFRVKKYVQYLFGAAFLIFVLNKFMLRPWVLENDLPELFKIVVFSLPNTIEAIMGTIVIAGLSMRARAYFNIQLKDPIIYLFAVVVAAIYVLSQELNYHSLGGDNVYDPYDLTASAVGLSLSYGAFNIFGFTDKPEGMNNNQSAAP